MNPPKCPLLGQSWHGKLPYESQIFQLGTPNFDAFQLTRPPAQEDLQAIRVLAWLLTIAILRLRKEH